MIQLDIVVSQPAFLWNPYMTLINVSRWAQTRVIIELKYCIIALLIFHHMQHFEKTDMDKLSDMGIFFNAGFPPTCSYEIP